MAIAKRFLIFKETKSLPLLNAMRLCAGGVEGTYAVEAIGVIAYRVLIDTAPEQGALGDGEFEIDGDVLTITWLSTNQTCQTPHHVDTFRRRAQLRRWSGPPASGDLRIRRGKRHVTSINVDAAPKGTIAVRVATRTPTASTSFNRQC